MTTPARSTSFDLEAREDAGTNTSANTAFADVVASRLSRRDLGAGLFALLAADMLRTGQADRVHAETAQNDSGAFTFTELKAGSDETHHVAQGYRADVLIRWGDKVAADAPAFQPTAQTASAQQRQFGYNNDFIGFLPLDQESKRGLLVVNHEYTIPELMFAGLGGLSGKDRAARLTADQVAIEMMAHGGSVIEIERADGQWRVVPNSAFARRITADTEIRVSGPAAGHDKLRTSVDPAGERVKGMLNNCAGAMTPWGTWLTCEENINYYFGNKDAAATHPDAAALKRYGIPTDASAWSRFHDRFDIAKEPNEPHRFGWVVEIDPREPASMPVKRTALGRFKHEGAGNIVNRDGRFVVYQGDDERFEYVYRFVTRDAVDTADPTANRDLLDHGTLYVARFAEDGTGRWLPLQFGKGPLTPAHGFNNQGDVVIFARQAADLLGATKMDRPEDIEANPKTNAVYLMLTNNTKRKASETDAANPRPDNRFGHIVEIRPDGGDHATETFAWDILVRCGDPAVADVGATFNPATTANGWFANPDNCVIDPAGRLWIATDGNDAKKTGRTDGIWAVETEGADRATSRLFFRVPIGAEMCGPCFTPDMETLFVAVQHPGEGDDSGEGPAASFEAPLTRWPDFRPDTPPRPSVVAITRIGGGKIASNT